MVAKKNIDNFIITLSRFIDLVPKISGNKISGKNLVEKVFEGIAVPKVPDRRYGIIFCFNFLKRNFDDIFNSFSEQEQRNFVGQKEVFERLHKEISELCSEDHPHFELLPILVDNMILIRDTIQNLKLKEKTVEEKEKEAPKPTPIPLPLEGFEVKISKVALNRITKALEEKFREAIISLISRLINEEFRSDKVEEKVSSHKQYQVHKLKGTELYSLSLDDKHRVLWCLKGGERKNLYICDVLGTGGARDHERHHIQFEKYGPDIESEWVDGEKFLRVA